MLAIKLICHYGIEIGRLIDFHTAKPLNPTVPSMAVLTKWFTVVKRYLIDKHKYVQAPLKRVQVFYFFTFELDMTRRCWSTG